MKNKKVLVQKNAFSLSPKSDLKQLKRLINIAHQKVISNQVYYLFIAQFTKKVLDLDKINFGILYMI